VHTSELTIIKQSDDLNNANTKIVEQATEIEQLKATAASIAQAHAEVLQNRWTLQLHLLELASAFT
jgi:hypothetical protein